MRSLIAVMIASSTAAAAPARPPVAGAAQAGPPALFASLFREGASWTFQAEHINGYYDEKPVREVTKGEVSCAMSNVHTIKGGWSGELACSGMDLVDLVNGTYVATARGLWQVDDAFEDVKALDPKTMLIAATPKAGKREHKDAEPDQESGETYVVRRHAGGWCFAHMTYGGDEGGWMLCVKPGKGLIGGNGFFAGGATRDTYFGEVPRY